MADIGDLYDGIRKEISKLVLGLSAEERGRPVPATPGWSIRDVVSHLTADASYVIEGDYPREFFAAFGEAEGIAKLNAWTGRQVYERIDHSLDELLDEWEASSKTLVSMMRGETPWPDDVLFADRVMLTDAVVHQQDIFGALGIVRGRDAPPIRVALGGYLKTMGWRLDQAGIPALAFDAGDKIRAAGTGAAAAAVRAPRFEFFRALSGRRSPAQILAWEWDGDPAPYVPYFYPYGVRRDALDE